MSLHFADYILDSGLNALKTSCDQILICSSDPTDYASANSAKLGAKNFGAPNAWASVTSGTANTRQLSSTSITDGSVTANGTAAYWAAVDSANSRLLAAGSLASPVSVNSGWVFTLGSIVINVPKEPTSGTLTAPVITNIRTVSSQNTLFNVANNGTTGSNNVNIFGTSAYAGGTIKVYFGGTLNGQCTADGSGNWMYTPGVLSDATRAVTATVTVGGNSSPASNTYNFTIGPNMTSLPVSVGQNMTNNMQWYMDGEHFQMSCNKTGPTNNATAVIVDLHTISFTNLATDIWSNASGQYPSCRTEAESLYQAGDGHTWNVTYEFMIPNGEAINTNFDGAGWCTTGQIHDYAASYEPFNIFRGSWSGSGPGNSFCVTIGKNGSQFDAYEGSSNLTQGVWHTVDIIARLDYAGGTGNVQVWLDGARVVNQSGNLGTPSPPYYWKHGLYRGDPGTGNASMTMSYRNWLHNYQ